MFANRRTRQVTAVNATLKTIEEHQRSAAMYALPNLRILVWALRLVP